MFTKNKKKSLTDILETFSTTISELEALAENNNAKVKDNAHTIEVLEHQNQSLDKETASAEKVRKNLEKLIEN